MSVDGCGCGYVWMGVWVQHFLGKNPQFLWTDLDKIVDLDKIQQSVYFFELCGGKQGKGGQKRKKNHLQCAFVWYLGSHVGLGREQLVCHHFSLFSVLTNKNASQDHTAYRGENETEDQESDQVPVDQSQHRIKKWCEMLCAWVASNMAAWIPINTAQNSPYNPFFLSLSSFFLLFCIYEGKI